LFVNYIITTNGVNFPAVSSQFPSPSSSLHQHRSPPANHRLHRSSIFSQLTFRSSSAITYWLFHNFSSGHHLPIFTFVFSFTTTIGHWLTWSGFPSGHSHHHQAAHQLHITIHHHHRHQLSRLP